jgi:hypothetical protein
VDGVKVAEGSYVYRSTGSGAQRKGSGNMIDLAKLDVAVIEAFEGDHVDSHTLREFVAGDDRADQVDRLRDAAIDAYRAGDKARFMELVAQVDELAALGSVAPHWVERAQCDTCGLVDGETAIVVCRSPRGVARRAFRDARSGRPACVHRGARGPRLEWQRGSHCHDRTGFAGRRERVEML